MDTYVYPETDILKNIPGIKDKDDLANFELTATSARVFELLSKPLKGKFDFAHYKAYHKHIFQDVYPWAGKTRTVNMSKDGEIDFAFVPYIDPEASKVFADIKERRIIKIRDRDQIIVELAKFMGNVNVLHPFREGNTRTLQTFVDHLARQCKFKMNYSTQFCKNMGMEFPASS
jgi:cell filamentation protein